LHGYLNWHQYGCYEFLEKAGTPKNRKRSKLVQTQMDAWRRAFMWRAHVACVLTARVWELRMRRSG
jgi:hypothetical protein